MRLAKQSVFLFLLILLGTAPAYSWPFGEKKKVETKKVVSSESISVKKTISSVPAVQEEDFFESKDEEETELEAMPTAPEVPQFLESSNLPNVPKVPKIPQIPDLPSIPKTSVNSSLPTRTLATERNPIPQDLTRDAEVLRIQKQINEIIQINESLKNNFTDQASQIQKISEQAKIHGQILKDLESTKTQTKELNEENYINQEKVRLIQKQTEENKKYLEGLQKNPANTGKENSFAPKASRSVES